MDGETTWGGRQYPSTFTTLEVSIALQHGLKCALVEVAIGIDSVGSYYSRSDGYFLPLQNSQWLLEFVCGDGLASSTNSSHTWNMIRYWWTESMERSKFESMKSSGPRQGSEHGSISIRDDEHFLKHKKSPTRLLDLKHADHYDNNNNLRLSIAGYDARDGPYMTLSYRWAYSGQQPKREDADDTNLNYKTVGRYAGMLLRNAYLLLTSKFYLHETEVPMKQPKIPRPPWHLTKQSIEAMRNQISFTSLPQVYQDAIFVARELNIRYLWIDAMCIIQGDDDDWSLESSKMGQTYQQAICNIAAGVETIDSTLFGTRNPEDIMPLKVRNRETFIRLHEGEHGDAHGFRLLIEHDYANHHLSRAPLNGRGWVLQERLLSKRILHFSPEQVFWREGDRDACELFPIDCLTPLDSDRDIARPEKYFRWDQKVDPSEWNSVVHAYSLTSLTKPGDKMAALAGLAQHWLTLMPDDKYRAGLWNSTFPHCLLWKVTDGRDCNSGLAFRSAEFRAPSWSWLSVNAKVEAFRRYDILGSGSLAEIVAFELPPDTLGFELGPLKAGAYVVVRCRIKSAGRIYWPLNTLLLSAKDQDWSLIQACTAPFSIALECSIDDMTAFLKRWNNTVPSEMALDTKIRWFTYYFGIFTVLAGAFMPFMRGLDQLGRPFYILSQSIGLLLIWFVWHFTNLGSAGIFFLEIYDEFGRTKGLIVERQNDNTYSRLGVFTVKGKDFFADTEKQDTTLV